MTDPDPDPNRLQELISSNALIASFMGPPVSEGGGDIDGDTNGNGNENENENKEHGQSGGGVGGGEGKSHKPSPLDQEEINKLLHSISCSCDIDALIAGIASDLCYFVKHPSSFYYDSTNDSGSGRGVGVKGVQTQVQAQVKVNVGDNTTATTSNTNDNGTDGTIIGKSNTNTNAADGNKTQTQTPAVRSTSGTGTTASSPSSSSRSLSEFSNAGDDNSNNVARSQVPTPVPTPVPVQLQTLVYRISRIKSLLYNEAPSLLSPSENTTSNSTNNSNNDNTQTSSPTSFIQQIFPILSSTSNDQPDQLQDNNMINSIGNNQNTIVSDYQHKQNVKKILRTLLLTKSEISNTKNNTNINSHRLIIPTLLQYIHLLPFEIRKNVSSIFNYLLVNTGTSSRSSRQEFVLYVRDYFNIVMDFIVGGHFIHGINLDRGKSKKGGGKERKNSTTATTSTSTSTGGGGGINDEISGGQTNSTNRIDDKTKAANADGALTTNSSNSKQETKLNAQVQPTETVASSSTTTQTTSAPAPVPTQTAPKKRLQSIHRTPDVALHCGSMLRSIIRHPILYAQLVRNESNVQKYIFPFLDCFVNQPNFETASDALETLRLILHPTEIDIVLPSCDDDDDDDDDYYNDNNYDSLSSANDNNNNNVAISTDEVVLLNSKDPAEIEIIMEKLSSTFLERDYTPIFAQRFNPKLLSSDQANYITRRVSLQLLSSILLTRSNYSIMIKYVSSKSNLRTIMMLLRDSSAHITLEAFNVFKIFVANPNKPPEVVRILADNKIKLIKYLSGLHKEREDMDEQFRDEKILVISTLEQMVQLE